MEQNVALIIKYQNVIFLVVVYRSFSVAVSTARHIALLSQTFLTMIWFDSDIVPVCSTIVFLGNFSTNIWNNSLWQTQSNFRATDFYRQKVCQIQAVQSTTGHSLLHWNGLTQHCLNCLWSSLTIYKLGKHPNCPKHCF